MIQNKNEVTWQKLFLSHFKKGDPVIIITEDDRFDWGKLDWDDEKIFLYLDAKKGHAYYFYEVTFMCHEGFPVRKLKGADGSDSVLTMDNAEAVESARKKFAANMVEEELGAINDEKAERRGCLSNGLYDLIRKTEGLMPSLHRKLRKLDKCLPKPIYPRRIGFGDPFEIEAVGALLFNKGNSGPAFWRSPFIETMVLQNKDRLVAHLWSPGDSLIFAE